MNQCETCLRNKRFDTENYEQCERCGSESLKLELRGHTMTGYCFNCGECFAGASYFAPCEEDNSKYSVIITGDTLTNREIIDLRNLLKVGALSVKNSVGHKRIDKYFSLKQIMEIAKILSEKGISYAIEPEIQYDKYDLCDKKML